MVDKENILEKARRAGLANPSAGMKVPDGYFDSFVASMNDKLPYRPEAEDPNYISEESKPKTTWQQLRPYVYLAAMFAGIWLMLQVFASVSITTDLMPIDENPVLSEAFSDENFVYDYCYNDYSSFEIIDDINSNDIRNGEPDESKAKEPIGDTIYYK